MDAEAIRELTDEEIQEEIRRAEEELFRLRFRKAYQELESPALLRTRRRELARLKTIRRERQLEAAENSE
ncbi:MAG: 50S ribosomal protein L29 [Gemmatimonadota bacterium]|jgi:large subunit ribosomal protein L29|nr:MAG: 50S ribosomal protein L29 [Gemmatimonadota bacterium]